MAKALARGEITPLEVMLETMQKAYEEGGALAAFPYAKEIPPYLHPKRQPVDDKGSSNITVVRVMFGGDAADTEPHLAAVVPINSNSLRKVTG